MGSFLFFAVFLTVQDPLPAEPTAPAAAPTAETAPPQKPPETPPPQSPEEIVRPAETKRSVSTVRKIVTNFWQDQEAIWTSPLNMNRKDAKWWALFGSATVGLVATDRRTSKTFPNTLRQISFSKNVSQIGATYTTLPVAGALYLYGRAANNPKARETGVLGAEALLDSYILVAILKVAAGRERPEVVGGNGRFFKGERSFPSGHSIMSWSFASLISHEYRYKKIVPITAYSLAGLVSAARFTAEKHYASDIVAGGAMGWFIGKYVFDRHHDPAIHKRYDPNVRNRFVPEIMPAFDLRTHTVGISLAWNP